MSEKVDSQPKDDIDPGELNLPEASTAASSSKPQKFKAKKGWKNFLKKAALVLAVLILMAFLAFGGYIIYDRYIKSGENPEPEQQQSSQNEETAPQAEAEPLTETYNSPTLRLELKHPTGWAVNEVDRGITISSPKLTYADNSGQNANGNFKIFIRKGARSEDGKYLARGIAASNSEKIKYTKPETGQHEDTYLTPFGLDNPDNFAYFIVQGNFDLEKGETLGPDYAKEPDAFLIVGGYSEKADDDSMNTVLMPLESYSESSQYLTGVEIIKSLKLR